MPIVLTTSTLLVALLAAAASVLLMPLAGLTLAYVGLSGTRYDVPRALGYPVATAGLVMLLVGFTGSIPG